MTFDLILHTTPMYQMLAIHQSLSMYERVKELIKRDLMSRGQQAARMSIAKQHFL